MKDVVIVGARCAGAALATALGRAGLDVCVVDRARFPSPVPTTHILQLDGAAQVGRLGLAGWLRRCGAPPLVGAHMEMGSAQLLCPFRPEPGDPPGAFCVQRTLLDTALVELAAESGADVRTGTTVTRLLRNSAGRVTGVAARDLGGEEYELRARLTVGADGRRSTVARSVGSRRYNVVPAERFSIWTYFKGCREMDPEVVYLLRGNELFTLACRADSGLFLVCVMPPRSRFPMPTRQDADRYLDLAVSHSGSLASRVRGKQVGRPHLMAPIDSYFREATGPGWLLVGDAGRVLDPCTGRGMGDALRQAEEIAELLPSVIDEDDKLDRALLRWWRQRDQRETPYLSFWEHHGRSGPLGSLEEAFLRSINDVPVLRTRMGDVHARRRTPVSLLTPRMIGRVTLRTLRHLPGAPGRLIREVGTMATSEARHRWRVHRPRFSAESTRTTRTAARPPLSAPVRSSSQEVD